jgi:hypothetical protein
MDTMPAGQTFGWTSILFPFTLSSEPEVVYVPVGETLPAACPGGPEEPEAEPGTLCVYQTNGFGVRLGTWTNPETSESAEKAGRSGVILQFLQAEDEETEELEVNGFAYGTWAVTAE